MTKDLPSAELDAQLDQQLAAMRGGSVDFYGEDELRGRLAVALREGRPLRVKLGMDPSSPDLHIGHTIVLMKLKCFQELGHTPIFLVGDFTARIGDPSGRSKTRPALDEGEVRANAETYVQQVSKILDVDGVEVRFNSEWMSGMTPADFVRLCSCYTVARLLERDDFAKRMAAGTPIFAHEFLYPFVQAYDSVALRADVELGGSDQTFNLLMAREIQRDYGQPAQAVITHPLLVGTDGREKMSKSLGNSIGITDPPEDMYGKVMSIADSLMGDYIEMLGAGEWGDLRAACERAERGQDDPMVVKKELASRLVARLQGVEAAHRAEAHFRKVIQRKDVPEDIPEQTLSLAGAGGEMGLLEIVESLGLSESRAETRRLVKQRAVSIDGERVEDPTLGLPAGRFLLRVGRRRFARVTLVE
jgi:tyrosyl-tRNA synthetase